MVNPISGSGAKRLRPPHVIQLVLMSASALAMLWLIGGFLRAVGCWVAAFAVLGSCSYLACRSVARLIADPMTGAEAWRHAVVGLCCLVAIILVESFAFGYIGGDAGPEIFATADMPGHLPVVFNFVLIALCLGGLVLQELLAGL